MVKRNYREVRANVTEEIKREVSQLVDQEKDWEKKKKHPGKWYREETARILKLEEDYNPSLRSYEELLREIRKNARQENPDDKPWSTALLDKEPTDLIPWLLGAQFNRRQFLSKPLTVRESRWFARLWGLKNIIKPLPEMENKPELKSFFISNVLSMWAEIYARREKIDSAAGIKERDFTDLDVAVFKHDPQSVPEYADTIVGTEIKHILACAKGTSARKIKVSEDRLLKLIEQLKNAIRYVSPLICVRRLESDYLFHSLGEFNIDWLLIEIYRELIELAKNKNNQLLEKASYLQRLKLFMLLRKLCKEKRLGEAILFALSDDLNLQDVFKETQNEAGYPFYSIDLNIDLQSIIEKDGKHK